MVLRDGREVPLSRLPLTTENIREPKAPGEDFFGDWLIKIVGTHYNFATSVQSDDTQKPSAKSISPGSTRCALKPTSAGDYPLGDETQRRKIYSIRAAGANQTEACFVTLIEPSEGNTMVAKAEAIDADHIRVELKNGHVQTIALIHFTDRTSAPAITLTETDAAGHVLRTESTD